MGRAYTTDDDRAGAHVVVITYRLWQDQYAGAPDILDRVIRADGEPYEVIGVLPATAHDHRLFARVRLFSPLSVRAGDGLGGHDASVGIIGRRLPALSAETAEAFIASAGARIEAQHPSPAQARVSWRSEGLPLSTTGPTGKLLIAMLIGLATSVLVIAGSNLAHVLFAGAIDRRRESAVRAALGASRLQLICPLLVESACLTAAGGLAAVLVAMWTAQWLRTNLVDAGGIDLPMDWRVGAFALASSMLTLVFVGLAPALFTMRVTPNAARGGGGRTHTSGRRQQRVRGLLIAAEFALATVLLTSAGLFLKGTIGVLAQDYGWRSDHVLQGNIQLPDDRYNDGASIGAFYARVVERLQRLPGVHDAAVSYGLPYLGLRGQSAYRAEDGRDGGRVTAALNGTSPAYFRVTGTRLVAGRAFTDADALGAPGVAIVSESLARALFPSQAATGRRIVTANDGGGARVSMEIVGVVADTGPVDIARTPNPFQVYQPVAQDPRPSGILAIRTTGVPPDRLINAMRAAVGDLDPNVVLTDISTGDALVGSLVSQFVVVRQLLEGFAALGTFLALIGIYGVMSRMVAERTAEIGIRMALGAQVRGVVQLIAGAGARVALAGAGVGLLGAVAISRIIANGFPGMDARPLPILASTIVLLVSTAFGVCLLSARRAAAIDPVVALRND